jgi:hypothetical protein
MGKQHGHEAQKFRTDKQHERAARKNSRDTQHGHAFTSLKTLAFLSSEWIWALEPGFQCECAFFLLRSALFAFSRSFLFLDAPALVFCFALASAKKR